MDKNAQNQQALDLQHFEHPVRAPSAETPEGKSAPQSGARKVQPAPKPEQNLQPFLPGLSRRGRPRKKDAIPSVVRASESRQRRLNAGARRIEILLEAPTASLLDTLVDHHKISRVEMIARLIDKAGKLLQKKTEKG